MRSKRFVLAATMVACALALSSLLITVFVFAQTPKKTGAAGLPEEDAVRSQDAPLTPQAGPVVFQPGDWPWYAQEEISVDPDPPLEGQPVELCAKVINTDAAVPYAIDLEFSVAAFGIGVPFHPVGATALMVPAGGEATGCVVWIPPRPGHWCIQVTIHQEQSAPLFSQRNMDVGEPLEPGIPHAMAFPVGNPSRTPATVTLGMVSHLEDWGLELSQDVLPNMQPDETAVVTLTVTPPRGAPLGTGSPIVDVEGYIGRDLIGGFRKLDTPPVPLHRPHEPFFAESEIHIDPYPPRAGEPTEICVELRNISDAPQTVRVTFGRALFGIGLPFDPIGPPKELMIPPGGHEVVCTTWVPPEAGHFCVQVQLEILGEIPYVRRFSQRNLDVAEPLEPGVPHASMFLVGNSPNEFTNPEPVLTDIWLEPDVLLPGWEVKLDPTILQSMQPGEVRPVMMTVTPPQGIPLPPDGTPVVDVRALVDSTAGPRVIGGIRKVYRPPVPLHRFPDPPYAEREITVDPYPPRAGEPTEVCVGLTNPTAVSQTVAVQFSWAAFGIGIPFTPIDGLQSVVLPPYSAVKQCIFWVPPVGGHVCLQVELHMEGYEPQRSQRNIDIDEPLVPGEPHALAFPVGNPFQEAMTITMGLIPRIEGWQFELSQTMLPNVAPGAHRVVSLTVLPPAGVSLPTDATSIVDVEAYAERPGMEQRLIGGFRKIFRPPVPLHRFPDPPYAEREITVNPYPPRAGEPTEICVELRNPTDFDQNVAVQFSWAAFGIGLPFMPIDGLRPVSLPAHSVVKQCINWVPPVGGHLCLQVELFIPGYEPQRSQRNMDVDEPLEPLIPHARLFPVGNPLDHPVTITLGLIPHLEGWRIALSQDVLPAMAPGEIREVTLTVTPPGSLPPDGTPIVDIEAYAEGRLIGGFRKIFRPPVPIHRPRDPIYAESEIGVDPYPAIPGQPTLLSVEVFNPTDTDRFVTVTFSIADFGIGLPFSTANIAPNPIRVFVPKFGAARGHVVWTPPDRSGKFCVRVTLRMEGHDPIWSQRNIDVGEPLEPGIPHAMTFLVGNPSGQPATVTLGLIPHLDGWGFELSQDVLPNVQLGQPVPVTLTVTPPRDALLGTGVPIVDVEGYVNGELIGGFRKLDRPPVPLHKPHEKGYAESEIVVDPYPPLQGSPTSVSTVVQNASDVTMTVDLEFGWANYGFGIPFTTTGMTPYTQSVTLGPVMTKTATVTWRPALSGPQCVQIRLNSEGYESQESRRNVDVRERPPCGETRVYTVTIHNDETLTVTVDVGLITFNVPADWQITITPSPTLEIGPLSSGVLTVNVQIPCLLTAQARQAQTLIQAIQQASGSIPTIDVEGYVEGELIGGIEIQFAEAVLERYWTYLPLILRNK